MSPYSLLETAFCAGFGFTVSAIAATLYRMLSIPRSTALGRAVFVITMIPAGPFALCVNAAQAYRSKQAMLLSVVLSYLFAFWWSVVIGYLVWKAVPALQSIVI